MQGLGLKGERNVNGIVCLVKWQVAELLWVGVVRPSFGSLWF